MRSLKSKILVVFIISVLAAVGLYFLFVISGAFAFFMPQPAEIQIKYGEFPFRLTYELDGEINIIEDIIICEQTGVMNNGTAGKSRKWDIRLKSGEENITLLNLRTKNLKDELDNEILELYFYYGNAIYYMENKDSMFAHGAQDFDTICYAFKKGRDIYHSSFDASYALERFNIRLISWECAPPIENKLMQGDRRQGDGSVVLTERSVCDILISR